jgi:hypothetical protein
VRDYCMALGSIVCLGRSDEMLRDKAIQVLLEMSAETAQTCLHVEVVSMSA